MKKNLKLLQGDIVVYHYDLKLGKDFSNKIEKKPNYKEKD